jgi:HlyD family secretion protein
MFGSHRQIFRTRALERISSPDDLDDMIQIVSPRDWVLLAVLASLLALALAWGIRGRVPTTVAGRGVLISMERVGSLRTPRGVADPVAAGALVNVSYFAAGSGQAIRPGMRVEVTPDGVERRRFGSITGVVLSVSDGPVVRQDAGTLVGSADVAREVLPAGPCLEVITRLDHDGTTRSGYHWSSSGGPPWRLSPGMKTATRVTVATRRPITYLFPSARELARTD